MPPYRHWPGTTRHNSAVIANSFMPSRDCSAEKGLLSVAADRSRVLTGWWHLQPEKNHFLSGPASGPYHWLLPSACRLGKHFFRAHKNLCFVVDFFLLFFTTQLINEKVFFGKSISMSVQEYNETKQCRCFVNISSSQNRICQLDQKTTLFRYWVSFPLRLRFFFRSISCNRNLYCNHTRPIFKKYPVELYAYTTMHTQT